jgi:hypothetical protein
VSTILTVPALWSNVPATVLPDIVGTRIRVAYNNTGALNVNANDGMVKLCAALVQYKNAGPIIVIGWSEGASVIKKTLREQTDYLISQGVTPDLVRVYTCGDPEALDSGGTCLHPTAYPSTYPGTVTTHTTSCPTPVQWHGGNRIGRALPLNCPWTVDECICQYDWPDCPDNDTGVAHDNWNTGKGVGTGGRHNDYNTFRLIQDAQHGVWVDPQQPTVTYRFQLCPDGKLPLALKNYPTDPAAALAFDQANRPTIEAAYTSRHPYVFGV